MKRTSTSAFGVSKRQGHDASAFYKRQLYAENGTADTPPAPDVAGDAAAAGNLGGSDLLPVFHGNDDGTG